MYIVIVVIINNISLSLSLSLYIYIYTHILITIIIMTGRHRLDDGRVASRRKAPQGLQSLVMIFIIICNMKQYITLYAQREYGISNVMMYFIL